jgi:hypothetical protein
MKIAVPTKDWVAVSGHAGQARCWLVYDLTDRGAGEPLPSPTRASNWRRNSYSITFKTAPRIL